MGRRRKLDHRDQEALFPAPPEENPFEVKPRYYQEEAVEAVFKGWKKHKSVLLHMATGTGKTVIFSDVAKRCMGRVLVLCHRGELIDQAVRALGNATGEPIGIEQAEFTSGNQRIVVGSVQTVYREERYTHLLRMGGFDTVILDEGRHYIAPTYRAAVDAFPEAEKLYVDATPKRGDGAAMGQVVDKVVYKFDILDGIKAGYLVPFEGRQVHIEEINLSQVKTTRGDLDQSQLDIEVCKGVEGIVSTVLKEWPDRKGICFFPKKRSARLAAERFNALSPGCAVCIDDDTPKDERKMLIREIHAGKYRYLCGVMIFTEGFDWPECDLIANARLTKSTSLYTQIIGRGGRILPGLVDHIPGPEGAEARRALIAASAKPKCIVADFVGNAGKHQLCSPVDVLGGDYTPPEITLAKKLEEKANDKDEQEAPEEYLEEARAKLAELAAIMKDATVKHSIRDFSPFGILNMKQAPPNVISDRTPATAGQMGALINFGLPATEVRQMSLTSAKRVLGNLFIRRKLRLASYRQLAILKKNGIDTIRLSTMKATDGIRYIHERGQGNVDAATLRHIVGLPAENAPKKRKRRPQPKLARTP